MSIPHDYHDGHRPELRSRGNSRHYIDPDHIANEADDQLPLISTIGRGPRGHGLLITNVVDEAGDFSFIIRSDFDGEVLHQTGNLSAGVISVSAMPADPVAGETVSMDVAVTRGPDTQHFTVPIPAGSTGSRIYCVSSELTGFEEGKAFQAQVSDLMVYGLNSSQWDNMPVPRVNDVAVFKCDGRLCLGTIEAVENGMAVFTSQVGFDVLQKLAIDDNGHWLIDGEDTGVMAQGAPGKDGESAKIRAVRTDGGVKVTATDVDGTTEAVVKDGADGFSPTIVSTDTPTGVRLEITDKRGSSSVEIDDGTDGRDGLPAIMKVRSTTETQQPYVNVQRTDADGNVYSMDFGLPRGADGKSIDIQGGVYKIDQLPDFDSTPVNRAFIVSDYEENEDYRYDLYIRGIDPVIAEEGGPWTVVEDWQGMPGFSIRYIHDIEIDADTPVQVSDGDIEATFVPSAHIADGDLVLDDHGCLGVIGSATDNNGYVTVTYVTKLQVHWDDVLDRPSFVSTDSIELTESDGTVKADLRVENDALMVYAAEINDQGDILASFDHLVADGGLQRHGLMFEGDSFAAADGNKVDLSDSVKDSLSKADSAVQEADLTAAIQAEASAREKADGLLETEIDGKLGPEDIVAGKNISVTHDPVTGHVTIENTMKLTDSASGIVAHAEDAYAQKPIEVRVKGKTWVNRWPKISGSSGGITVSTDETGLITISGTNSTGSDVYVIFGEAQGIADGKQMTFVSTNYGEAGKWRFILNAIGGGTPEGETTFTVTKQPDSRLRVVVTTGTTVDVKCRVMLVDGTEAPDCFTPPASITSAQPENLVTSGKNLFGISQEFSDLQGWDRTQLHDEGDGWVRAETAAGAMGIWYKKSKIRFMPTTYTVSFEAYANKTVQVFYNYIMNSKDGNFAIGQTGSLPPTVTTNKQRVSFQFTLRKELNGSFMIGLTEASSVDTEFHIRNLQIELGSTATAYEPPTVTTTPLPEVELRSLPNGTCDELVIKADGTCEVERKTVQVTFDGSEDEAWSDAKTYPGVFQLKVDGADYQNIGIVSDRYSTATGFSTIGDKQCAVSSGSVYFGVKDSAYENAAAFKAALATNPLTVILGAVANSEPQSPVTLPALPAPTFNQYHDADIPSETSVEFLTEEAEVLTRFLMPGNIKAGSNVSVDVDGNDVTVSSSGGGGGAGGGFSNPASDEDFDAYIGLN